jgi:hypothetical protein
MKKFFQLFIAPATLLMPIGASAEEVLSDQEWQQSINAETGDETFTLPRGEVMCSVSYHEHLVRLTVQHDDEILHLGHFTRAGVRPAGEPIKGDVLAAFRALGCHGAVPRIESKAHRCDYMMIVAPYGPRQYDYFRCTAKD